MRLFVRFARNDDGATAIEYGLIAALIAVAAIVAFSLLGINLIEVFTSLSDAMSSARGG